MLTGIRMSIQVELDTFFVHLVGQAQLLRMVSEQAFVQARAKLSLTAIPSLNDWFVAPPNSTTSCRAGSACAWSPPTHRRCISACAPATSRAPRRATRPNSLWPVPPRRRADAGDLAARHRGVRRAPNAGQHLDRLSGGDLLLLDRGYPSRWLVALLIDRSISFCMRVEKAGDSGFACVCAFLRSGLDEQVVTLNAPSRHDTADYEFPCIRVSLCTPAGSPGAPRRAERHGARAHGQFVRCQGFPASAFGDLYNSASPDQNRTNSWRRSHAKNLRIP